jgi:hypothetical protein
MMEITWLKTDWEAAFVLKFSIGEFNENMVTHCSCGYVVISRRNNCSVLLLALYRLTQHRECITLNLFYFVKITICFDHFIWSSSGEYKMYNKCSLELQTTVRQIWAHIYNDVWWMTILAIINTTYSNIKIVKY